MSVKIPGISTKTKKTVDTQGKTRRYKAPTRANLLNKFKKIKKKNPSTSFDNRLQPMLVKNVLANKKVG